MSSTNQVNTVTTENVVPVGATYDANGNFITLVGAAGAPINTLSGGGTANGVAYLNGSKVLTTGSALTFDGTNLGIGTTSPDTKLDVVNPGLTAIFGSETAQNAYTGWKYNSTTLGYVGNGAGVVSGGGATDFAIGSTGARALLFGTNDTERMRLDSSGNLLVGKTATSGSTLGAEMDANGSVTSARASSSNSDLTWYTYSTTAAAARFYVGMGGTVYATSTTITAISDVRLKENIRDLDDGLNAVMALKPRKFDWKAGKGKNKKDDRGWIAQEFEQVFPDMVDTWADPAPEGEEPYKAINADLIPTLVKAIQEQQALIQSLTDRIAQLEAK